MILVLLTIVVIGSPRLHLPNVAAHGSIRVERRNRSQGRVAGGRCELLLLYSAERSLRKTKCIRGGPASEGFGTIN